MTLKLITACIAQANFFKKSPSLEKLAFTFPYLVLPECMTVVCCIARIFFRLLCHCAYRAANSVWGKSIKEYVCVDTSSTMTDMANVLHRQGDAKSRPSFKNVFYRNFMPVSTDVKYDVVIAAHSLSELTSEEDRWRAIETLWQKTEKYLVRQQLCFC